MIRNNIKKLFIILIAALLINTGILDLITGLDLVGNSAFASSNTMNVSFSESSSQSQSKTVTIPNLTRVTSASVNTGNVSYAVNGNNVTLYVSNGSPSSSYTDWNYVSNYEYHSGASEPPSSVYYSEGEYSGTLSAYNYSNKGEYETKKVPRDFTATVTNTRSWTKSKTGVGFGSWSEADHGSTYYINEDGYSGTIPRTDTTYDPSDFSGYDIGDSGTQTATGKFEGTLYKTEYIWHDDWYGYYSGYIYGSTTDYYSYNVTLNYVTNKSPSGNIITPAQAQVFSEATTSLAPVIAVSDPDGDTLTCKLFIDSESAPRDTKTISNTVTAQNISFNAQNIGLLSEGVHKMKFTVYDGEATIQNEISFTVDKTPPAAGTVTFTSTDTNISISGTATDNIAMHSLPYCFAIGSSVNQWSTESSHTFSNLAPNTKYTVKFKARDKAGHITEVTRDIFTKAAKPSLSAGLSGETSLTITIADNNPSSTEYLVKCGTRYVNAQGLLSDTAVWIKPTGKSIRISGLNSNSSYYLSTKARNTDNIETAESTQIQCHTLASPPSSLRFGNIVQNSITISWDAVVGIIGYDIEVDGVAANCGTSANYLHTGLLPETSHTYRVRIRNAGGTGNWSVPFSCTTLTDRPGIPENIDFIAARTEITISWNAVPKADGYDIEADGIIQDNGSVCSYTHQALEPDSAHKYRVRAKNKGGAGEWSGFMDVITLPNPPEPPSQVNSDITKNEIKLSWMAVPKTVRYEVEVDGMIIDNGSLTSYMHNGLTPLTRHQYRVRGINAGGTGEWSGYINLTTHPYEPGIPENVMASSDGDSINLSWYMAAFAWTYEVEIDGDRIEEVTSTDFVHSGLVAGSCHTYRVRSKNISGTSNWTSPISIYASSSPVMQDLAISNVAAVVTYDNIMLSWESVADSIQYEVEADGILINNGFSTVFNHANLKPGTYHNYKIRIKSELSNEWGNILALSTLPLPPGAPVITKSSASENSIQIWWEPVMNAVSYDIEADGQVIEGITDITYLHTGLLQGTTHQYRVRARMLTDVSPWSEILEKTTGSTAYKVNCTAGEEFDFSLLAWNVQDFKDITFVVTYDSSQLEVVDLFGGTPQEDILNEGQIPWTNVNVIYEPGRIEFTVDGSIVPGTVWSGEISNIIFKAKATCTATIDFNEKNRE